MHTPSRSRVPHTWALVLAGGDGSRLRSLTMTPRGVAIPKQFCSLHGGPSLLAQALARAGAVTPALQTCAVVACQHTCWWGPALAPLARQNIFVQPQNKGTAHGLLLALLHLEARDPPAIVVILPADHHIRHEDLFAQSLRQVSQLAGRSEDSIYLLGTEPEFPDTELGYIVPAERGAGPAPVLRFVEKPDALRLGMLLKAGALWSMFIIAGRVHALLDLFRVSHGSAIALLRSTISRGNRYGADLASLTAAYEQLPVLDFSRDLLEARATALQVLNVPPCGWNDLGTPKQVIQTLAHAEYPTEPYHLRSLNSGILSLADQLIGLD